MRAHNTYNRRLAALIAIVGRSETKGRQMNRSFIPTTRLVRAIAVISAVAAMSVPVARALPNGQYGQLDPWAYTVISEHSSRQNGATTYAGGKYGPHDPWAYNAIRGTTLTIPLVTEHSAGQNSNAEPSVAAANPASASVESSGFNWRDAGIGATSTLALLMLVASAIAVRRQRAVAHPRS